MNESLERVLLEALALMDQGLSVDDIIGRYPEQAGELRPFLLTAAALSSLATQPALSAELQSKRMLLEAADRASAQRANPARTAGGWLRRLAVPALALLAVVFLAGAGLIGASGSAVPGDALYETKRLAEEMRLNLTANPERATGLREQFRLERLREIEQLLTEGRRVDVSLSGTIESMAAERWMVDGVAVVAPAGTAIDGEPVVGALVEVDGRTAVGVVEAERVRVLTGLMPQVDPTPAPPPPPTADDNRNENSDDGAAEGNSNTSPDSTQEPAVAPGPSVSPAPVASPTLPATAQSTSAPPPPTATPDQDDNANDNGGDNANDNGGDNANDNGGDNANDNGGDNANDNGGDNANDNGGDNANDNGGDNANDNGGDNANDNGGDNANDNGGDNANDNGGDNANDNGGDNANDNGGDNANDNN
ncbi:MAG: hypothetical protein KA170_00435 [Candidatus Promineofilum sp.]|nr:hypothetical protein [Promineifilum sp.]